ncbi:hypothetical protein [Blautia sp. Marseille-P3201T]|uniref:hypothetical protein n=1 Tax=Blautia sp. Marseille-P3201T TaxID=1907659 RepID=UPI000930E586|nr:hypothetical protein [Blautia sp. Marseille-P3201T]
MEDIKQVNFRDMSDIDVLAAYLSGLKIPGVIEEEILVRLQSKPKSKEQTIIDLQKALAEKEARLEETQAALKEARNELKSLRMLMKDMEKTQKSKKNVQ